MFNFSSHPGIGPNIPLTFVTIGDLGQTNNSQSTLDHIQADIGDFTAILHFGDLSYADGNETRWDTWGRLVQVRGPARIAMHVSGTSIVASVYSRLRRRCLG